MAKCWTCGANVSGLQYICLSCKGLKEIQGLQKKVVLYQGDISEKLDYMEQIQREGFRALTDTLSSGLSEIASTIEWGFGEISWQLQQQTDILRSIDHTLKTPGETQANEWREMAEELRRRGVLDESEEFYLKALELNRLDYRIYVGLAETYLQINKFDKAKIFLEKSLPHAPSEEIDYKSYSYRLIGHIYACEEDYNQAVSILRSSIELSPTYEDGHYDYAQYCAQIRNKEACLSSLEKAILAKPLYWYLAHKERSFGPVRSEVEKLLARIRKGASSRAKDAITNSESPLKEAREAVFKAKEALIISKDKAKLNSSPMCGNAEAKFELAKEKGESGDYVAILEAKPIADEAHTIANETKNEAYQELKKYQDIRAYRVKKPWKSVHIFIWLPLVVGLIAGIGGCTIGIFVPGKETTGKGFSLGFFVGLIVGFILCIYIIKDALEGK